MLLKYILVISDNIIKCNAIYSIVHCVNYKCLSEYLLSMYSLAVGII